ncbi:MAG: META domain-containing protein [Nocardioides sp.]
MIGRIAGLVLILPLVAACGDESEAFPDENLTPIVSLPSGDFIAPELPEPFSAGDQLQVTFTKDGVSFSATCNQMSGNARVVDGLLRVSSVGGTEMGCPGAGFEQDEWLVDFFTNSPALDHEDVGFTLSTADTSVRFLVPDAVADEVELEGTAFRLTGFEETDGDAVGLTAIPPKVDSTLLIDGGRITLRTGCNDGSGRVSVLEDRLELRGLGFTLMGCLGPSGEVERGDLRVLVDRDVDWSISGTQLRLSNGDHALVYEAE